ncbi:phosphotransferase [Marinomonas sp. 2405UD68-3]|uniref:phosphotransferase n=1 Tax=Marinomonas sp. 2405UD68-3 TaxID=3391835 RepID=UPI0039C944C8
MREIFNNLTPITHLLTPISELILDKVDGGFSNKTYVAKRDDVPYFIIRVPCLDKDRFLINREYEKEILPIVTELGLSPRVVHLNHEGFMVSQFVPQIAFPWDVKHTTKDIKRLAESFKAIHQLNISGKLYKLDVVIKHYLDEIRLHPNLDVSLIKQCEFFERITKRLYSNIPNFTPCTCHNDLNPQNCLANEEKFWVIDWEYSGLGDPLFDLAVVKSSHNLTSNQTALLITEYNQDLPLKQTLDTLEYYHALYLVREMVWMLLKFLIGNDGTEDLNYYYIFATMLGDKLSFLDMGVSDEFAVFTK